MYTFTFDIHKLFTSEKDLENTPKVSDAVTFSNHVTYFVIRGLHLKKKKKKNAVTVFF